MKFHHRARSVTLIFLVWLFMGASVPVCFAGKADVMREDAQKALKKLYDTTHAAKALGEKAEGILVFPEIMKAGFLIGGQYGNGVLFNSTGATEAYYRSFAASYGLQAGFQRFGYVLFFMTRDDLNYIYTSDGWEIGVGPSIVLVDAGMAKVMSTTTTQEGVYAFIFDQKGVMAGLGIQGTKITRIYPR